MRMHTRSFAAAFAVCLTLLFSASSAFADVTPDDLGEGSELFWQALTEMGLSWDEVRFDLYDYGFYNQDKYTPHLLKTYFDNPWKASPYSRMLTDRLLNKQDQLPDLLNGAQSLINQGVRVTLIGDPLEPYLALVEEHGEQALAVALAELCEQPMEDFLSEEYYKVPVEVRKAAALFCFTLPEVIALRRAAVIEPVLALKQYDMDEVFEACLDWVIELPDEEEAGETRYDRDTVIMIEALLDNVDFTRLNTGATLLAACVERMAGMLADYAVGGTEFSYCASTPYGKIFLSGGINTVYDVKAQLLILDVSGDDCYLDAAGSTQSWENPVSVVIDFSGNDNYQTSVEADYRLRLYYDEDSPDYTGAEYEYSRVPCAGAGVLGYGMVLDLAGNDEYDCQFLGQGCGVFGTGMLVDRGGNDHYIGIGGVQGSGWFGTGILADSTGDDHYELYRYGQGFGFTGGVGLLIDGAGSDEYVANNTDIVYDSIHSPVINLNLAQGFGYGRRDDYGEGHSWGGGVGILVDGGAGDDSYDCGIYALGSAYWAAVGILRDCGGNDRYMSAHYTLAAPPHYACGVLLDDSGDDVYYGYLRQTLGHGRDWSLGWFEDGGGNDWYQGGHMSFGQGDVNSIGVFWDKAGDDTYLLYGPGFGHMTMPDDIVPRTGASGSIRWYQFCLGLFIDGGGYDRYLQVPEELPFAGDLATLEPDPFAADGTVWHCGDSHDAPNAHSVGIDAE